MGRHPVRPDPTVHVRRGHDLPAVGPRRGHRCRLAGGAAAGRAQTRHGRRGEVVLHAEARNGPATPLAPGEGGAESASRTAYDAVSADYATQFAGELADK